MMKRVLAVSAGLLLFTSANAHAYEKALEFVLHQTRIKILDSNNVTTRPGSVYDTTTYFESLFGVRPNFNYEFVDTGLGTAEPLYPLYQKGYQANWGQLIAAFFSEKNRHIDHFTSLTTPEGCKVDSIYLLRHISEYPKKEFVEDRKEGYQMIVIRLEYYTRLRPDAQCGRHRAHDPDPNFDPMKFLKKYRKAMHLTDIPKDKIGLFEARISVIKHLSEVRGSGHHARFELSDLKKNTLWYYQDGHGWDYGLQDEFSLAGLPFSAKPRDLVIEPTEAISQQFSLDRVMHPDDFGKLLAFLDGKPTPDYRSEDEPGNDTLRLSDVTAKNVYTSGLNREPIESVREDVSNPSNFSLVGITIKPFDEQTDAAWTGTRVIPQIRLVYQLRDPKNPERHFEQLFFHLKYDVVDRDATDDVRAQQMDYFLKRWNELSHGGDVAAFLSDFTALRPIESINFSSALTGVWIFGSLSRSYNPQRELKPVRIVRNGIDVGYYSSIYDNDLFRAEAAASTGDRKKELEAHLEMLTVSRYRDPKREDPHALDFNKVTCAQCHQMSGRDAIHFEVNDGIDRRITSQTIPTEFLFQESKLQLQKLADYLKSH